MHEKNNLVSGDPNVRGTGENDPRNDGDEENTTN